MRKNLAYVERRRPGSRSHRPTRAAARPGAGRPNLVCRLAGVVLVSLPVALAASPVHATGEVSQINSGDTAWVLIASAFVLMMTVPGLLLFYGGMVRRQNVVSTIMQSFTICGVISVVWILIGYRIAFGDGGFFLAYPVNAHDRYM